MMDEACDRYRDDLMALFEGALTAEAESALLRHIEACPACRAEHEWLAAVGADLEAVGDAMVTEAPQVDLIDGVMAEVARLKAGTATSSPKVVPFGASARRFRPWVWVGAAAAAAAAVLVFWAAGFRITKTTDTVPGPTVVQAPGPQDEQPGPTVVQVGRRGRLGARPAPERAATHEGDSTQPGSVDSDDLDRHRWGRTVPIEMETTALAALTVDDVLAARRDAITDPGARAQLAQWASLTVEKARELAASGDTPLGAKVGAAQALPPEEAEPVLLAALAASPSDPYVRYKLAGAYAASEEAESSAKAVEQLTILGESEPDNALLQYQVAVELFGQGDVAGAMAALEQARELETATAYTGAASRQRVEALVASGMDPELAGILTALTAGAEQYSDLVELGQQLLGYGREQEELGDTELAQGIYESVYEMGTQVAAGASYSAEELAGLDLQQDAIEVLSGFFEFLQLPDSLGILTEQTNQLVSAFEAVGQFFEELDAYFAQQIEHSFIGRIADAILNEGDLNLFEVLFGTGGTRTTGADAPAAE